MIVLLELCILAAIFKIYYNDNFRTNTLHLSIIAELDWDNFYYVSCPVFKSSHSYSYTIVEALNSIREVIEICAEKREKPVRLTVL